MVRGRVQFRLDREVEEQIEQLAAELELPKSAVLRLAVEHLARSVRDPGVVLGPEQIAAQRRKPGPRPSRVAQRDRADAPGHTE
jgi:hypothetical protein